VFVCDNTIVELIGHRGRQDAIVLFAYKALEPHLVRRMVQNGIKVGLDKSESGRAVAISIGVNKNGAACDVLAYYDANQTVKT
jgi:hypothetical protein